MFLLHYITLHYSTLYMVVVVVVFVVVVVYLDAFFTPLHYRLKGKNTKNIFWS